MHIDITAINGPINVKALRNFILDSYITEEEAILLNENDFDELALDYRVVYSESLPLNNEEASIEIEAEGDCLFY